jgi:hypothetical protein
MDDSEEIKVLLEKILAVQQAHFAEYQKVTEKMLVIQTLAIEQQTKVVGRQKIAPHHPRRAHPYRLPVHRRESWPVKAAAKHPTATGPPHLSGSGVSRLRWAARYFVPLGSPRLSGKETRR